MLSSSTGILSLGVDGCVSKVNGVLAGSLSNVIPCGVGILGVLAAFLFQRGSGGLDARLLRLGVVVGMENGFSPSNSSSLSGWKLVASLTMEGEPRGWSVLSDFLSWLIILSSVERRPWRLMVLSFLSR